MGWAPGLLFTGLCNCFFGTWDNLQLISDSPCPLLLDNVPLSVAGLWTLTCFLILTALSLHISRNSSTTTATRSQVRGSCTYKATLAIIEWISIFAFPTSCTIRGEGFVMVMHHEGAASWSAAKTHDQEPQRVFEPYHTSQICRTVAKRSYKRACNRVRQHGYTWYRGCLVSADTLGVQTISSPPDRTAPPNLTAPSSKRRQRLLCFSWNAGGLSSDAWDALQLWLERQNIDILALQETHWPFSSEWAQERYWVMHSGTGQRGGGLLCMVSKRLCPAHLLTWHEPIPGRLLHLRIHGNTKNIDVVNVYQHVHASDRMDSRSQLWHQLSILLDSLPKRNNVIMMGDMNTSLQRRTSTVGLDTYCWKSGRSRGPTHQDAHLLQQMIDIHSLVALNTWHHNNGPTYTFDERHSRIDFVFCRIHLADATSRKVQYLKDFPLQGLTGASHVPLMTSLLKVWHLEKTTATTGWSKAQRLELCQQWLHPNERIQTLQPQVQQSVQNLPMSSRPLDDIHAALKMFPPNERPPVTEPIFRQIHTHPFECFRFTRHVLLPYVLPAWGTFSRCGTIFTREVAPDNK